ncbi:nitrite reductase large subunit [Mycobacteroides abscessus subsp. massiliense]|nr:nitrite reductase large subunit [Mycobacteroides abscessus subsp. massiliense]
MGVDVASFGDAHATADGALEVVFNDATKGTYAKLVVSDDARTLLGGILVGDASAYGTLRPMLGRELPADPASPGCDICKPTVASILASTSSDRNGR